MDNYHTSVLLKEVIDYLQVGKGKKYIDATLGGGGHAKEIILNGGIVLGIDVDQDALDFVKKNQELSIKNKELILVKGNFVDLDEIAGLKNFSKVSGILFDLGVSSHQIDTAKRGFSFLKEGPLDMRMDKDSSLTAETLINLLEKGELYELFNKLGQESRSWFISNSIVRARRIKAIQTTGELARVVQKAYGIKERQATEFTKNLANKKVFQALRIAVNSELLNLEKALPQALNLLDRKARILVISFHSLEDAIVKKTFKEFEKNNMGTIITKKPIEATKKEFEKNSRAKSAKLRVFEKN